LVTPYHSAFANTIKEETKMKNFIVVAFAIFAGMTASNFFYEVVFGAEKWNEVARIGFHQFLFLAVLIFALSLRREVRVSRD
jgi:hypothetical protein